MVYEGVGLTHVSGQGPVADSCEHGNESLGFIKGRDVELLYHHMSMCDKF